MNSSSDDCYYYYYSSCTKAEHCPYRHCEAALGSEYQCTDWQTGQCYNTECPHRHMQIEKKRNDIACYWESQAGGCRKPHCVFQHNRPRDAAGTILSEEEKIEAITSPPPQMSMPMADGPSPHDIYYDALPQDSVIRAIDSPAVEKVIINPFEEETDEESIYGTPVKNEGSQRARDLQIPSNQVRKQVLVSNAKQELKSSGDLNFAVKSLDQIRKEKLERAKRLIEEADQLFSGEDAELGEKVAEIKEKLVASERPRGAAASSRIVHAPRTTTEAPEQSATVATKKIKVNPKSSAEDLPEVKSYEEILREKALASMMAAKAKKQAAKEEEERKEREEKERKEREARRRERFERDKPPVRVAEGRRVIVRRRSDSPKKDDVAKSVPTKQPIRARLGINPDRQRLATTDRSETEKPRERSPVPRTRPAERKPDVKSRLGFNPARTSSEPVRARVTRPSHQDKINGSKGENNGRLNERVGTTSSSSSTTTTKRSIKDRLGNNQPVKKTAPAKARSPTPPPRQSDNLAGITMSDFSSDGLSDESSEDEEALREKQRQLMEKLAAIEAKKKPSPKEKRHEESHESDDESDDADESDDNIEKGSKNQHSESDGEESEEQQTGSEADNKYPSEDEIDEKNSKKRKTKATVSMNKAVKRNNMGKSKKVQPVVVQEEEEEEEYESDEATQTRVVKHKGRKPASKMDSKKMVKKKSPTLKRKIVIENKDDMEDPSPPKIARSKAAANIPSKKKKVKKASPQEEPRVEARRVMLATENSESEQSDYSEEEEHNVKSAESASEYSEQEEVYSAAAEQEVSSEFESEEEEVEVKKSHRAKVTANTKTQQPNIIRKAELKLPVKSRTKHSKVSPPSGGNRDKKTNRMQLYRPPALKFQASPPSPLSSWIRTDVILSVMTGRASDASPSPHTSRQNCACKLRLSAPSSTPTPRGPTPSLHPIGHQNHTDDHRSRSKPVKVITVKDRLNLNRKKRVSRSDSEEISDDDFSGNERSRAPQAPRVQARQVVTMKPITGKLISSINKDWEDKRGGRKNKRSVSRDSDLEDEIDSRSSRTITTTKRSKTMFSPITFETKKPSYPRITVTSNQRSVSPGSFEDELDKYRNQQQHKSSSSSRHKHHRHDDDKNIETSSGEASERKPRTNVWSTRSRSRGENVAEASSQIPGARKLSIHRRLGNSGAGMSKSDNSSNDRKLKKYSNDNDDESLFDISTPKIEVKKKSWGIKSKSTMSTASNPLRVNVAKANISAASSVQSPKTRGTPKLTSPKSRSASQAQEKPQLKSPPGRRSSKETTSSAAQSAAAAKPDPTVTKADVAAMLQPRLNPSDPVVDNELNLDDTDQLEAELLELLGGGSSGNYNSGEPMDMNEFGDLDDDLLLEDLL